MGCTCGGGSNRYDGKKKTEQARPGNAQAVQPKVGLPAVWRGRNRANGPTPR